MPKIHTLEVIPLVGHLRNMSTNIYCPECRRQIKHFSHVELVLDYWPMCDLVSEVTASQLFASERLLEKFEESGVKGYEQGRVSIQLSGDFLRQYPEAAHLSSDIFKYYYLIITNTYDGPWKSLTRGENCKTCGYPKRGRPINEISVDRIASVAKGDVSNLEPTVVDPVHWTNEDIFYHTEKSIPIITERVVDILSEMENFRRQNVENKEKIRQVMPKFAAELDKSNWTLPACSVLGPAAWATEI